MKKWIESCIFLPTYLDEKKLMRHLSGKTILITGASSGIGAQVAYQLANIHCQLILVARNEERLFAIKTEIERRAFATVSIYQADLRNEEQLRAFLDFLHTFPKGIDIVVNNAGLSINRSIFESLDRFHDFTRTMAINYFAPVQLLLSMIPVLLSNHGQIINVSSVNARLAPVPYFSAYQASKSAFDMFLRSVAFELRRRGVFVSSIYLPLVRTPMIEPTAAYKKIPAMSPQHAAKIICKHMYTKKKRYQPWWLVFGQIASFFMESFPDYTKRDKRGSL
ncbi:epimerase [Lysinibacillus sp. PLM2]|nr:epimerase [Lysinibacillus sp. PLM2]